MLQIKIKNIEVKEFLEEFDLADIPGLNTELDEKRDKMLEKDKRTKQDKKSKKEKRSK